MHAMLVVSRHPDTFVPAKSSTRGHYELTGYVLNSDVSCDFLRWMCAALQPGNLLRQRGYVTNSEVTLSTQRLRNQLRGSLWLPQVDVRGPTTGQPSVVSEAACFARYASIDMAFRHICRSQIVYSGML